MCAARTVRLTGAIGLVPILGYSRKGKDTGHEKVGAKAIYAALARCTAVLIIQRAKAGVVAFLTPSAMLHELIMRRILDERDRFHFPSDSTCILCGCNDPKQCILVAIDDTYDHGVCEAIHIHVDCIMERFDKVRYSRKLNIIYVSINSDEYDQC